MNIVKTMTIIRERRHKTAETGCRLFAVGLTTALALLSACSTESEAWVKPEQPVKANRQEGGSTNFNDAETMYNHFTAQSTVADVINDEAFGNFGRLLFPVDRSVSPEMTLAQVSTSGVYMWYPYIRVEKTVEVLNYLHAQAAEGHRIFFPIYSAKEIATDPSKAYTGLFLFRGAADSPFAVTNAGGGFAYVGAMHDSFPHSLELSRAGYSAFALIYRPDDPYRDLARAITFIYDNAATLRVSADNYSLWGGSAGARMAATLGNETYLRQLTGRSDIPQAAAVVMQYTGYSTSSETDPPTYSCVGSADGIASWRIMQNRLQRLSAMGIPTEFHVYEGLGHGFGIGTGTVAEGWIADAVRFWKANMSKEITSGIPIVSIK